MPESAHQGNVVNTSITTTRITAAAPIRSGIMVVQKEHTPRGPERVLAVAIASLNVRGPSIAVENAAPALPASTRKK